ncbi:alpha/beta hydrolase [Streptomyces sp. NBC_00247]|uniref:alpha/beta fold hydrolase n=1 Tax=Streptomyces sp. NBC_00247 TaxID=2975689 RepID=UPI002E27FF7B|nr:alpha/beta hydrolase [Streptomyces sp. NBC_00247]
MAGLEEWAATAVEVFGEIKPLADRLPQDRFEVVVEQHAHHGGAAQRLLDGVSREVGLRQAVDVRSAPEQPPSSFGLAVERRISGLLRDASLLQDWARDAGEAQIGRAAARARDLAPRTVPVRARDGLVLDAFATGDPSRPAVVLVPPCGMPVQLSLGWLRALGQDHFVVTWQSRGLFAPNGPEEGMAGGVADQVGDLLAVMDAFDLPACHVMGLCGGAVIALDAVHRHPERFGSVSLWHGDYDFGADSTKTDHQQDVQALMEMGADSLGKATAYQKLMHRPAALAKIPERVAPLVLYPYATPELFHHYCRLNLAIMTFDITHLLGDVAHPTLVVTSRTDTTAHPAGSHRVARELARAQLVEEPTGDHLSVFDTSIRLTQLAVDFVSAQHSTTPGHR